MKLLKKFGNLIVLALGGLALIMLFIPKGVAIKVGSSTAAIDATTFSIIFGQQSLIDFNVLGLVAILLVVAGVVVTFVPSLKLNVRSLLAAALLVVGGALLLIFPSTLMENIKYVATTPVILAAVFSFVAGGISALLGLSK